MKRRWTVDELLEHWSLHADELDMAASAPTPSNQLGFALLLKCARWSKSRKRRKAA